MKYNKIHRHTTNIHIHTVLYIEHTNKYTCKINNQKEKKADLNMYVQNTEIYTNIRIIYTYKREKKRKRYEYVCIKYIYKHTYTKQKGKKEKQKTTNRQKIHRSEKPLLQCSSDINDSNEGE